MSRSRSRSRKTRWYEVIFSGAKSGRRDIQGLRTLAVVAVILDHTFAWPKGGFVGVDVFFVISGFLITGLLLREWDRTGRISFVEFYRRRVRRIIPGALAVLISTAVAAYILFPTGRFMDTVWDEVGGLFFFANWRFSAQGTDYFQSGGPTSPVQHFWSLAVEEQFYFVWPWLMLLLLWLVVIVAKRSDRTVRIVLVSVMTVISLASFIWAMSQSTAAPTAAYFSTMTRTWELGAGALLAVAAPICAKIPGVLRIVLAWIGLLGIFASLFLIDNTMPFPAPWAALPVLSTVLVIAANSSNGRAQAQYLWPLTNPVSVFIGDISYSLYLWHFPIVIFGPTLFPDAGPAYYIVALALIFVLSLWSYLVIEYPIHHSRFLERSARGENVFSRLAGWWELNSVRIQTGFFAVSIPVVIGALVLAVLPQQGGTQMQALAATGESSAAPADVIPGTGAAMASLQSGIKEALAAPAWPDDLDPSMESILEHTHRDATINKCGLENYPGIDECSWGDKSAPTTIAVAGDSTSVAYMAMYKAMAEASAGKVRVTLIGMYACPFIDVATNAANATSQKECPNRKEKEIEQIAALKPSVLAITNGSIDFVSTESGKVISQSEYGAALSRYLERVAPNVGKIAIVAPPPNEKDTRECYTPKASPQRCISTVPSYWKARSAVEAKAVSAVGGTYVDTRALYCASNRCPAFADGIPMKLDAIHIPDEYGAHIAPAMVELLSANKVDLGLATTEPAAPAENPAAAPRAP